MKIITKNDNKIIPNYCNIVNIVWIDRGILLGIIYYIIVLYRSIKNKKIIIDNKRYRKILRILFPEFKFIRTTRSIMEQDNKKDDKKYFYFNIRKNIKLQDIVIDYLSNYDEYVPGKIFRYLPWYDYNDPLIIYRYSKKYYCKKDMFKIPLCVRGNYNGYVWDYYEEHRILNKYIKKYKKYNIESILVLINRYLKKYFTDTVVYKYIYNDNFHILKDNNNYNDNNNNNYNNNYNNNDIKIIKPENLDDKIKKLSKEIEDIKKILCNKLKVVCENIVKNLQELKK